jgi:hypothetical protein
MARKAYPKTPDGHYFLVKDRLWRCTNPHLPKEEKDYWVKKLMQARLLVKKAKNSSDPTLEKEARAKVHKAKVALGERGPVWWDGDQTDYNRHHPKNTPYMDWWEGL